MSVQFVVAILAGELSPTVDSINPSSTNSATCMETKKGLIIIITIKIFVSIHLNLGYIIIYTIRGIYIRVRVIKQNA